MLEICSELQGLYLTKIQMILKMQQLLQNQHQHHSLMICILLTMDSVQTILCQMPMSSPRNTRVVVNVLLTAILDMRTAKMIQEEVHKEVQHIQLQNFQMSLQRTRKQIMSSTGTI